MTKRKMITIMLVIVLALITYGFVPKPKEVKATPVKIQLASSYKIEVDSKTINKVFDGPAGKNCVATVADLAWKDGVDTRKELKKSGINGKPASILLKKISIKEEKERAEALRKQRLQASTNRGSGKVSNGNASSSNQRTAGKYKGTHAQWDAVAIATLKSKGCTAEEVRMMMSIHHGEGGPNSVNTRGHFYGGWQLKESIAMKIAWWDPAISTARALQYVNGHVYQDGLGKGIRAAYLHKQRYDWY